MSEVPAKRRSHWPIVILSTVSTAFGVLLPLILVRIISPDEVGKFKIFFLYLTIVPAFALTTGVMNGLAYWAGQEKVRSRAIQVSSTLILLLAMFASLFALVIHDYLARMFGWTPFQATLFALSLLGAIAGSYFEEAAIATGKIWTGALFYSGSEMVRTLAILFSLLYFRSLTAVLIAHTAVVMVKLIAGYSFGFYLNLVRIRFDREILKSVWGYAFPVSLAWVFGIFVSSSDQFILATRIPASEFALYSIGCLSIAPILIFEHSITRVLIPQMSEAFSKNQRAHAAMLYQSAVENLSFLLIPAVAGLIVFATPVIEVFFTRQYSPAAHYLRFYALSYLFLIIPYDALPRARGQSNWILRTFVTFATLSLGLVYILVPVAGPMGALAAILVSGAALRCYAIYYFRKELSLGLKDFLPVSSLVQYALISSVLAALALVLRSEFSDPRVWFFVCGGMFAILYLLIALPMKNKSERTRHPTRGLMILTQSLNIGGLERMVLHLCEQIKRGKQWDVRVFAYDQCSESMSLLGDFHERDIPVEAFKKARGFSVMVVIRMLKSIYRNDIQVIHSQDLGGLIYAVLAKLCCFGRVSIVHTQHSFVHLDRNKRYRFYEKLMTFGIDKLSVVSEETRNTYLNLGVDAERIYLIENGVQFPEHPVQHREEQMSYRTTLLKTMGEEQRQLFARHKDDTWLLYLARFFPGKGQEHALQLWQRLAPEKRSQTILCLVGPESAEGEYLRIRALIEQCPDNERIFMCNGSKDPLQWLNAGDIFLSCSESEGMPLAPLEAAGAGVPLLLSDIPGHDFLSGISSRFRLGDMDAGAQQLTSLITRARSEDNENWRRQLWEQGRFIRDRFSVAEMCRKYSLLYANSTSKKKQFFLLWKDRLAECKNIAS